MRIAISVHEREIARLVRSIGVLADEACAARILDDKETRYSALSRVAELADDLARRAREARGTAAQDVYTSLPDPTPEECRQVGEYIDVVRERNRLLRQRVRG